MAVRRGLIASIASALIASGVVVATPDADAALRPACAASFKGTTARCELASGGFPVSVSASYKSANPGDHLVLEGAVWAVLAGAPPYLLFTCEGEGHGKASCKSTQYREYASLQGPVPDQAVRLVCEASVENHGSGGHAHGPAKPTAKASGRTACASGAAAG